VFGLLAVSSAGRVAGGSESMSRKMYCSIKCNSTYRFVLTSCILVWQVSGNLSRVRSWVWRCAVLLRRTLVSLFGVTRR
jgi:hypothetical protein